MQFKYPELLWALFLLLIPIIIHLFQLRRFKKTPFTNVKLLQKVVAESRRSSAIKKLLLLATRLLLLAGLVLAFAQPFLAEKTALSKKETVIYLDNSFSMQVRNNEETLLEMAVQDIIEAIPKDYNFSLFTNNEVYKNVTLKEIQNELLTIAYSNKQLQLDEIGLSAQNLFSGDSTVIQNNIVISDFQERIVSERQLANTGIQKHFVQLLPENKANIVIDTVFIAQSTPSSIELTAVLLSNQALESIPVSLFSDEKLIAKTAASFDENNTASVQFSLQQNEVINGRIEISDGALSYDNQLFFNLNAKDKIKVLAIGDGSNNFLSRLYADTEFDYRSSALNNLNYSSIEEQNFIVLNELKSIPKPLQDALRSFMSNGGSLVVIPNSAINLNSYNSFLTAYGAISIGEKLDLEQNITGISFSHPLYENVFEKQVNNFQYPKVGEFYKIKSRASAILKFQGNDPFLLGAGRLYLFTAALNEEVSNFKNSPLIVPTFYAMAASSLKLPRLYYQIGRSSEVDIPVEVTDDNILKVALDDYEFIPQQQYFSNKTTLLFNEYPQIDGIYGITDEEEILQKISFNHPRTESELSYTNIENLNAVTRNNSISELFGQIEKDNRVTALWKWFVILALVFMIVEIIIQKVFI